MQHFCSPKKVVPTVSTRYNREQLEQLGKYTGKLLVTTDPGIRVWYGMVTGKMAKPCEGSPLSTLQAYNQIISLLFSYYFPSCSLLFHISLFLPYCSLLFLLFTYYFPLSSLFLPYYFPIYNFLILPDYCPICLLGFQNDKLRHLEWLCFDCHAKCLKPAKIYIIWFPTKILDFTIFFDDIFPKNDYRNPKMMTLPDYSHFSVHPLATLSTVMLNVWNLQKHPNWIATLLLPPKSGSNCLYKI